MGSRWGSLLTYVAMSACVVWNIFNLFHYGASFFHKGHVVMACLYVVLCLVGAAYCTWVMIRRYQQSNKRK